MSPRHPVAAALRANPPAPAAGWPRAPRAAPEVAPAGGRRDRALVRLFAAACHKRWSDLPGGGGRGERAGRGASPAVAPTRASLPPSPALAAAATDVGCTSDEIRACVRHLVVWGGGGGGGGGRGGRAAAPRAPL